MDCFLGRRCWLLPFTAVFRMVLTAEVDCVNQCTEADAQINSMLSPSRSLIQVQQLVQPPKHAPGSEHAPGSACSAGTKRYSCLEKQVQSVEDDGVAVIIPGLGSEERLPIVKKNLMWLKSQGVPFECWIYVYRSEEEFPLNVSDLEPCHVKRHIGFWMGHVLALPLNETSKPWVLHMMDGVEIQPDVKLSEISRIMQVNNLGHATPTWKFDENEPHYNDGIDLRRQVVGQFSYYTVMESVPSSKIGRFVDFVELHVDVFSRRYFACLQDNIDVDNTLGWGMDAMLPGLCGGSVQPPKAANGRVGLLDHMHMKKLFGGAYNYDQAEAGYVNYVSAHSEILIPDIKTLGELNAP